MDAANGAPPTSNLVLIGMMCSGKSSAGRELAYRLDAVFLDTDEEVESAAGEGISEIWEREGEPGFRLREVVALSAIRARGPKAVVVATGGGILTAESSAPLLGEIGKVVYLRGRPETLAARALRDAEASTSEVAEGLLKSRTRPLIQDAINEGAVGLEEELAKLLSVRSDDYERVADLIVDVDDLDPLEVVEEILAGIEGQRDG